MDESKMEVGKVYHSNYHMSLNIEGCLRFHKRKKITYFTNDDGSQMSDTEARKYLAECQGKGWKKIPCSPCEGFDYFEHGCPGHLIAVTDTQTI